MQRNVVEKVARLLRSIQILIQCRVRHATPVRRRKMELFRYPNSPGNLFSPHITPFGTRHPPFFFILQMSLVRRSSSRKIHFALNAGTRILSRVAWAVKKSGCTTFQIYRSRCFSPKWNFFFKYTRRILSRKNFHPRSLVRNIIIIILPSVSNSIFNGYNFWAINSRA